MEFCKNCTASKEFDFCSNEIELGKVNVDPTDEVTVIFVAPNGYKLGIDVTVAAEGVITVDVEDINDANLLMNTAYTVYIQHVGESEPIIINEVEHDCINVNFVEINKLEVEE